MRYRIYLLGDGDDIRDRPIQAVVYEHHEAPPDAVLDELYTKHGQDSMFPVVEPSDSPMPTTVRDIVGSGPETDCESHGPFVGVLCPECAFEEAADDLLFSGTSMDEDEE
jgi:hypothetical protein